MNVAESFGAVSIRGRIAYGIMCAERYATNYYPEKDWKPLFVELWKVVDGSVLWDAWANRIAEIIPECLFEFPDYESSDFECLSREDYALFHNLQKGMPEEWGKLIEMIYDLEEADAFTNIHGNGANTLRILEDLIPLCERMGIDLPDPQTVAFSHISENDGRGKPFDPKVLSIIL